MIEGEQLVSILGLLGCGLAMGAINSLAGAAGVIGLVGLETLGGLDALGANASLRLAAVAIGISGWLGFRSRGRSVPPHAWLYGLAAIPGGLLGAHLALSLPVWVYRSVLLVVLLTVLWQQLRPRHPVAAGDRGPRRPGAGLAVLLFGLVGLHMGFLQVATGLVTIAVLTAVHSRDLVEVNATKMAIVICSSTAATAWFAVAGKIVWPPAVALAVGCGLGSFLASRWSVARGHGAVRTVVLVITVAVLLRLSWQMLA